MVEAIVDTISEYKLYFAILCNLYIIYKATTSKDVHLNSMIEHEHKIFGSIQHTSIFEGNNLSDPYIINNFVTNASLAVCSTN